MSYLQDRSTDYSGGYSRRVNVAPQDDRVITARFSSVCPLCNNRINEGEQVLWKPQSKARHLDCPAYVEPVNTERFLHQHPVIEISPVATASGTPVNFGIYTIVLGDKDRITLKVADGEWAQEQGRTIEGKQAVKQFTGSLNESESSYKVVGFLKGGAFYPTRAGAGNARLQEAVATLVADPAKAGLAYALESKKCWRCNRLLTVDTSINRGLGPDCAKMAGYAEQVAGE